MAKFPVLEALEAGMLDTVWRAGVHDMLSQVRRERLADISEGQAGVFVAAALIVRSQEEWMQLEQITDGDQDKDAYQLWEALQDRKESVQFVLFNLAKPERGYEAIVEMQLHLAALRGSVAGLVGEGYGVEGEGYGVEGGTTAADAVCAVVARKPRTSILDEGPLREWLSELSLAMQRYQAECGG